MWLSTRTVLGGIRFSQYNFMICKDLQFPGLPECKHVRQIFHESSVGFIVLRFCCPIWSTLLGGESHTWGRMYIKFLIISFIGMGIQLVVTFVLVENFEIYYMYSAGIAILCAGSIGYIANRRWTFGIKFKN